MLKFIPVLKSVKISEAFQEVLNYFHHPKSVKGISCRENVLMKIDTAEMC
jgi:hypothetical protein